MHIYVSEHILTYAGVTKHSTWYVTSNKHKYVTAILLWRWQVSCRYHICYKSTALKYRNYTIHDSLAALPCIAEYNVDMTVQVKLFHICRCEKGIWQCHDGTHCGSASIHIMMSNYRLLLFQALSGGISACSSYNWRFNRCGNIIWKK